MQKILLLVIVITLLATNSISGQTKELEESTKQWVFLSEGNPIDGVKRTAFRINNEQNEGQNLFILKIESSAELVKIENSTGEGKNDRDNILVNIRSSESFENLDEILMYFDNEKIFYKVNFRKYSNNGLIWWNAVSSDDE
jgi:GTPase